MSARDAAEVKAAAVRAMEMLAEYEQARALTKKQAVMKLAFRTVLDRGA